MNFFSSDPCENGLAIHLGVRIKIYPLLSLIFFFFFYSTPSYVIPQIHKIPTINSKSHPSYIRVAILFR